MNVESRHRELTELLVALREGEVLILGEPVETPERRGLLKRRPAPPPTRYVQFLRDPGGLLYGECVGSTVFGGDWETTEEEHQRIRALGWLAPGDPDPTGTKPSYPNYWVCVEGGRAAELASMALGALDVLSADPARLESKVEKTR